MTHRRASDDWSHIARLPGTTNWHPEVIKAAIRMRLDADGVPYTLERLALENNLPAYACRAAIRKPHEGGEQAIAKFLGLSPCQIWPSRFRQDGTRIPRVRTAAKPTPLLPVESCAKQEAA